MELSKGTCLKYALHHQLMLRWGLDTKEEGVSPNPMMWKNKNEAYRIGKFCPIIQVQIASRLTLKLQQRKAEYQKIEKCCRDTSRKASRSGRRGQEPRNEFGSHATSFMAQSRSQADWCGLASYDLPKSSQSLRLRISRHDCFSMRQEAESSEHYQHSHICRYLFRYLRSSRSMLCLN